MCRSQGTRPGRRIGPDERLIRHTQHAIIRSRTKDSRGSTHKTRPRTVGDEEGRGQRGGRQEERHEPLHGSSRLGGNSSIVGRRVPAGVPSLAGCGRGPSEAESSAPRAGLFEGGHIRVDAGSLNGRAWPDRMLWFGTRCCVSLVFVSACLGRRLLCRPPLSLARSPTTGSRWNGRGGLRCRSLRSRDRPREPRTAFDSLTNHIDPFHTSTNTGE